jgi:cytoskeletal protein CcmA (bactofilin family)
MGIFGKAPEPKPAGAPPAPSSARPPAAPPSTPAGAAPQAAPAPGRAAALCLIGSKTHIKGEIAGDEDVVVEGIVEGHVRITRDLRVSTGGTVRAIVEAQSVIVSGEVVGDCTATQRVEIQATGRLTGNIRAPRIVIAEGALFKGTSDMSARKDKAAAS